MPTLVQNANVRLCFETLIHFIRHIILISFIHVTGCLSRDILNFLEYHSTIYFVRSSTYVTHPLPFEPFYSHHCICKPPSSYLSHTYSVLYLSPHYAEHTTSYTPFNALDLMQHSILNQYVNTSKIHLS